MPMLRRLLELLRLSHPARADAALHGDARKVLGDLGEAAAAEYLKKRGCRILKRKYVYRRGDIDIIALDGEQICFVEVKTRRPDAPLSPDRTVTSAKRRKIRHLARHYLTSNDLRDRVCRFDIISITYPMEGMPQIEHIPHAF